MRIKIYNSIKPHQIRCFALYNIYKGLVFSNIYASIKILNPVLFLKYVRFNTFGLIAAYYLHM